MKIAIIQRFLPSLSRGGVGHFTHGLANHLTARGHEVTVFSQDSKPADASYALRRIGSPGKKSKWDSLTFPFSVARENFSGFDVIHAQGDDQWISAKNRSALVRTLHGSSFSEALANGIGQKSLKHFLLHLYFYFWEWLAVLRADKVAAVSADTGKHFLKLDAVIPNGIDTAVFRPGLTPKADRPVLLFVGELHSRKRGADLVKLFLEQIKPALPSAELWMVCPDKIEGEGIRLLGKLSDSELAKAYNQAWVLCLPSAYEGFGRPYAEALACGTAVMATPNPGASEVLQNGKFGILSSRKDLAENLITLLKNFDTRQKFETLGPARAKDFAWSEVALAYERLYEAARRKHPYAA